MKAKYAQQYNAILKPNDVRNGNIISNVVVIIVIVVKVAAFCHPKILQRPAIAGVGGGERGGPPGPCISC